MKHLPLALCFILTAFESAAQSNFKAQRVYNDIFVVNSSEHQLTGEGSQIVKEISLPPNTVSWYYSFYASRDLADVQDVQAAIDLFSEVSKLLDKTGITAKTIKTLGAKPNSTYCDVYFLPSENERYNFLAGKIPNIVELYSRKNGVASEAVNISSANFLRGIQYLGFKNKNQLYPLKVNLQVVAVVEVQSTKNGWTKEQRNQLYNMIVSSIKNKNQSNYSNAQIDSLAACFINKLTSQYSYEQFNSLADFERNNAMKTLANDCKSEVLK